MSGGPTCGLWRGARHLVGAVVDPDGAVVRTGTLSPDEADTGQWLSESVAHCGPDLEVVLTESLARQGGVARIALELGHRVWIAPPGLIDLIVKSAWSSPSPRQLAAMLARLPRIRTARLSLRRMPRDPGPQQLRLF